MFGWNGKFLRVNLSKNKAVAEEYEANIAKNFCSSSLTLSLNGTRNFCMQLQV